MLWEVTSFKIESVLLCPIGRLWEIPSSWLFQLLQLPAFTPQLIVTLIIFKAIGSVSSKLSIPLLSSFPLPLHTHPCIWSCVSFSDVNLLSKGSLWETWAHLVGPGSHLHVNIINHNCQVHFVHKVFTGFWVGRLLYSTCTSPLIWGALFCCCVWFGVEPTLHSWDKCFPFMTLLLLVF